MLSYRYGGGGSQKDDIKEMLLPMQSSDSESEYIPLIARGMMNVLIITLRFDFSQCRVFLNPSTDLSYVSSKSL